MAHARMPRGNATAWISKPRHRSPPIRPGETSAGSDHGSKMLRPGKPVESTSHHCVRAFLRSQIEEMMQGNLDPRACVAFLEETAAGTDLNLA